MHNIEIINAERGIVVKVGCKMFAYGDTKKEKAQLAKDIAEYLLDPEGVEERYYIKKREEKSVLGAPARAAEAEQRQMRDVRELVRPPAGEARFPHFGNPPDPAGPLNVSMEGLRDDLAKRMEGEERG